MQKATNKVKVLLLVEDFEIGGLERVVESIFNGLDRRIYEPSLWCIVKGGKLADRFIRARKRIRICNLKTYHNPINILLLAFYFRKSRFHIIHAHGYFATTMGRIAAVLAGTPVIIAHVHSTYWNYSGRNLWIEKLLSRITDRVICCSNAVEDFVVRKEGVDKRRVVTIHNGVRCSNGEDGARGKGCQKDSEVRIVTIAALVENKGHRYMLEALSKIVERHKGVVWSLVGDGPLRQKLLEQIESIGITKHVELLGTIDNVYPILERSDIFVLPSVGREGLGMAIIEAMCKGIPVVASNIGGIPEAVRDGTNGYLVPPKDSEALRERLEVLISDRAKRTKMGIRGREIAEKEFDLNTMVRQIEDCYEMLLRKKRCP